MANEKKSEDLLLNNVTTESNSHTEVGQGLNYVNKKILAPMVRVGTLPMRILALNYGADLVYTEEIIDFRLLRCKRIENNVLGTVDYIDDYQNIVFRTCEFEKSRLILQIGTCDHERALKCALKVKNDVSGIDINMGCPKEFSLKGGMGAALLTEPEKVRRILKTLVDKQKLPVTCKIRVLPQIEDSLAIVRIIESTGVTAIGVHGRRKEERPQHKNRNKEIKQIAESVSIPVIANGGSGEIANYSDIEVFRKATGASSVMIARQAEKNCSIFRKDGKLPLEELVPSYLKLAILYDNHFTNTKYCIQQMLGSLQETERGRKLLASQRMEEICDLWDLLEFYESHQSELRKRAETLALKRKDVDAESSKALKKIKTDEGETWIMEAHYVKTLFTMDKLPKTVLLNWTTRYRKKPPQYHTFQVEKTFSSVVTVASQKYTSSYPEKNKKNAEQGAALVANYALGLMDDSYIAVSSAGTLGHEI